MAVDYKNKFGEIKDGLLTVKVNGTLRSLHLKDINKIQFVKNQKYHINYITFLLSVFFVLFLRDHAVSNSVHFLISVIAILLLLTSFFFKKYQYKFILIYKNHFIKIVVDKKNSREAKNIVYKIKNYEFFSCK
jgi:hypothetical protein